VMAPVEGTDLNLGAIIRIGFSFSKIIKGMESSEHVCFRRGTS